MTTMALTGMRPSEWARCPTMAVWRGRGMPAAEPDDQAQEFFYRGRVFEEIEVRRLQAKHGKDNVERQVVIPIDGVGEGHADCYIRPEKMLVEIGSTTSPSPNADMFATKVRQLRIYLAHHPEAESGAVRLIDPNRYKPADEYLVKLTDEERVAIEEERRYIVAAVNEDGPVDDHGSEWRPCTAPSQARSRMCPFAASCFAGWEPDPAEAITSADALAAASLVAAVKDEERAHREALKQLEERRKAAEAELAELVPVGDSIVGPYAVKRTHVRRSPVFSLKAYEAAGLPVEPLAPFFQPGVEYDTFRVSRAAEAGDVDFGDTPF